MEQNLHNLDINNWSNLSLNSNAIHILEQNFDKIYWYNLSKNPNAIHILENNLHKLNECGWSILSENPNAICILEKKNLIKLIGIICVEIIEQHLKTSKRSKVDWRKDPKMKIMLANSSNSSK